MTVNVSRQVPSLLLSLPPVPRMSKVSKSRRRKHTSTLTHRERERGQVGQENKFTRTRTHAHTHTPSHLSDFLTAVHLVDRVGLGRVASEGGGKALVLDVRAVVVDGGLGVHDKDAADPKPELRRAESCFLLTLCCTTVVVQ